MEHWFNGSFHLNNMQFRTSIANISCLTRAFPCMTILFSLNYLNQALEFWLCNRLWFNDVLLSTVSFEMCVAISETMDDIYVIAHLVIVRIEFMSNRLKWNCASNRMASKRIVSVSTTRPNSSRWPSDFFAANGTQRVTAGRSTSVRSFKFRRLRWMDCHKRQWWQSVTWEWVEFCLLLVCFQWKFVHSNSCSKF